MISVIGVNMIKIRKRRNPYLTSNLAEDILLDVEFEELSDEGQYSQTYKFILTRKTFVYNQYLSPGTYVLKILRNIKYPQKIINYLLELSDLKLIPEIFIITKDFTIMKYQTGIIWHKYIRMITKKEFEILMMKLRNVLQKWHDLGFEHGDLTSRNIIIDNNQIYLIDPSFHTLSYKKFIGDSLKYYKNKIGDSDWKSRINLSNDIRWTSNY